MEQLPPYVLRALAEALTYVGVERPVLPGMSPKASALKVIAAYLKAHNPVSSIGACQFAQLQELCRVSEKCKELIEHRRRFGTQLADYESCVNLLNN